MYTVAILGTGIIAESHIKAIRNFDNLRITALSDLNTQRAEALSKQYGLDAGIYADYQQMILEAKPVIAILCLPHFLHLSASLFCLEHGCHLLLEKPMAMNVAECDEIMAAAKRTNKKLMVGHVIHYYPESQILRNYIRSGELGRLLMINDYRCADYFTASRPGWFLDRSQSGGGMLMNLGAHSIDRILWITGRKVAGLQSFIHGNMSGKNVEGYARVNLTLEDNLPATITVYGYQAYSKNALELFFEGGVLEAQYSKGVWLTRNGTTEKVEQTFEEPFAHQLKGFVGHIEGGENPIPGEFGREVISCIEECYRQNGLSL